MSQSRPDDSHHSMQYSCAGIVGFCLPLGVLMISCGILGCPRRQGEDEWAGERMGSAEVGAIGDELCLKG